MALDSYSFHIGYADTIDNKEYEKQMQNLLDTHMSVAGIKQITNPMDILDRDELEKELHELGTMRSKADAIWDVILMRKHTALHFV